MRKGQSAMEYLMTYGWAILIVIIVGGVIWYYASQATTSGTAVKGGFSSVDVDSPWSLSSTGALTFKAINKVGKDITVDAVYINSASNSSAITTGSTTLSSGATSGWFAVNTNNAPSGAVGSSYQLTVGIHYYVGTDTSQHFNSTGTLSGTRQ